MRQRGWRAICANKVPGVRAALIHDHFSAAQGVEDDHMNIICIGGRTVGSGVAWDLVRDFSRRQVQLCRAAPAAVCARSPQLEREQ